MEQPTVMYIVGYSPLYVPNLLSGIAYPPDIIKDLAIPEVDTHGCLWSYHEGSIHPIIICDNAKGIHDHILNYSENAIEDWFEFFHTSDSDTYTIGIHPIPEKIVQRYERAGGQIPKDVEIRVFFQPLAAVCPISDHYSTFKKLYRKSNSVNLSLIDMSTVDKIDPFKPLRAEDIYTLGSFKISRTVKSQPPKQKTGRPTNPSNN